MDRRPTQISFADTDEWSKRIPKGSVWVPGRTWTAAHIHDADCRDGFATGGGPSIPPSLVLPLLLLKLRQG